MNKTHGIVSFPHFLQITVVEADGWCPFVCMRGADDVVERAGELESE